MKYDEIKLGKKQHPSVIPILVASIIFPLSVFFWVANYILKIVSTNEDEIDGGNNSATPFRWMFSISISVIFAVHGYRRKSLNFSGCCLAMLVGFFLSLSSYCFTFSLLVFFITSSRATKFRQNLKKKFEDGFKEGGQRDWIQVLCNGGMATELAILYLLDVGYGERPIDFHYDYRASWLGLGILGSLACANGDTWASELGTVVTVISSHPRLITSFKKVPKGTNGGVTIGGLLFSFLGGLIVGLTYYVVILCTIDTAVLNRSPSQFPLIYLGGIGGLLGSVVDSLLGATLQFSGVDPNGRIHEVPGGKIKIKPISGLCVLDNHSINLLSTIITGLLLPSIATQMIV